MSEPAPAHYARSPGVLFQRVARKELAVSVPARRISALRCRKNALATTERNTQVLRRGVWLSRDAEVCYEASIHHR